MAVKSEEEQVLRRLADECKIYRQEGIEILKGVAKIPAIESEIRDLQQKYNSLRTMIIEQNRPVIEKLDKISTEQSLIKTAIDPILRKNKVFDRAVNVLAGLGLLFFIYIIAKSGPDALIKLLPFLG